LALLVSVVSSYNCTWNGPDGSFYNLWRLDRWHSDDYDASTMLYDYRMNICGPSHTTDVPERGTTCQSSGYGICQYDHDHKHYVSQMGVWTGHQPRWEYLTPGQPQGGLKLTFLNGEPCRNNGTLTMRTLELVMPCTTENPGKMFHITNEDLIHCKFTFQLPSRFSCPVRRVNVPSPLPTNYRGIIEYTITSQNETFWIHEIHDERANRMRWDQYAHPGGDQITLFAYDIHTRFSIVNRTKCFARSMSPLEKMSSVFDLLKEHQSMLQYEGIEHHRGIACDVWQGHWTFYSPREGMTIREFARWYFARPEMRLIENPHLFRRPVAAIIATNRTHPALLGFDEHYISFIDFNDNLNVYAEREVALQWQWRCPGGPPEPPRPDRHNPNHDDVMSSGGAAGLSIFFFVLGGAIGFGGHWYKNKNGGGYEIQEL